MFNIDITDMITKVRIYFKGTKGKMKISLFGVVVVVAIAIAFSGGFRIFDTPSASPAPSASPVQDSRIRGVDLAQYCGSLGYDAIDGINNEVFCSSNIDLNAACNWQYGESNLHYKFDERNNPLSAICYNPQEKSYGGISDMRGYCKDKFKRSFDVGAEVANERDWACRTKIDVGLACSWQYQRKNLNARNDGGTWQCYE